MGTCFTYFWRVVSVLLGPKPACPYRASEEKKQRGKDAVAVKTTAARHEYHEFTAHLLSKA